MPGGANGTYPGLTDRSQVWIAAGGNPKDVNLTMASAVSAAENGSGNAAVLSPPNRDGSVDVGLWQINSKHVGETIGGVYIPSVAWLQDPVNNARVAVALSNNGTDWRQWCTAWSDNACGTKGGTYLGNGSSAVKYFDTWSGSVASGSGLLGALTLGAAGPGATDPYQQSPQDCADVWKVGPWTVLNSCQARAIGGGALMVAGGAGLLVGVLVVMFRFSGTKRLAEVATSAMPVAGPAVRAVSGRAPARRGGGSGSAPKREAPPSDQDLEDMNTEMRVKRMQSEGELGPRGGATPARRRAARAASRPRVLTRDPDEEPF